MSDNIIQLNEDFITRLKDAFDTMVAFKDL